MGSLFSIDTLTNNFTIKHLFDPFNLPDGKNPNGNLVEWSNGKLYGTTRNGGFNDIGPSTGGVIFQLDPITNSYIKKIDLDSTTGSYPYELIKANNNKLYGLAGSGGLDDYGNHFGTLFEYDPATNTIINKHNFGFHGVSQPYFTGNGLTGYLLQASNGKLYGTNQYGMFEYDYILDSMKVTFAFSIDINISNAGQSIIEICRKPSYRHLIIDTLMLCKNGSFNFIVQSTNANFYQWNKYGTPIQNQIDSMISISSIQLSDSGIYTCTMVNQCGVTESKNLIIKVKDCTGIDIEFGIANAIVITPNPISGEFQLLISKSSEIIIKKVTIRNLLGQVLYTDNSNN